MAGRERWRRGVVVAAAAACGLLGWLHHRTTAYDPLIARAAARNRLEFRLVKALIHEESWFRADVRGGAGELGLMQVSMAAARDFTADKAVPPPTEARLFEPELNIEIGSWYLRQSLDHYRDAPVPFLFALLRYNAGETRADHWLRLARARPPAPGASLEEHCLGVVDFPKTRAYARRILNRYRTGRFWF